MTRAAIYSRVSTAEQAAEGYSVEAQINKGRQYADLKDWEVVIEYRDGGISGAKGFVERPEGARLLKAAKAGEFDVLVMTKMDRFARSVRKALEDYETLEGLGVEVVFVEDNIDTTTPQGRVFRNMLLTFAEFERETIRDRNMAGRFAKATEGGGWAIGRVPFGYRTDEGGHLEIDEDEAEVIRLAFRLRGDGAALRAIAERLNRDGYTPRGQREASTGEALPLRFTSGSISHYIKQTYYRGDPIIRDLAPSGGSPSTSFEFPVPAIVTPSLWEQANRVSAGHPAEGNVNKRLYGVGGRIWHEHADGSQSTMFGQARKQGSKGRGEWLRIYRCSDSRAASARGDNHPPTCDGLGEINRQTVTAMQADWVEARVLEWMLTQLSNPEALAELIEEADEAIIGDEVDEDDDLRIRLARLGVKSERWAEQYAEGIIDKPTRDERLAAIMVERESIERTLALREQASAVKASREGTVARLLGFGTLDLTVADPEDGDFADSPEVIFQAGSIAPKRGTAAWWQALRLAASTTIENTNRYGRYDQLPEWAVQEVKDLAEALDIHVILYRSNDPRRPNIKVAFAPTNALDNARPDAPRAGNGTTRAVYRSPGALGFYVQVMQ